MSFVLLCYSYSLLVFLLPYFGLQCSTAAKADNNGKLKQQASLLTLAWVQKCKHKIFYQICCFTKFINIVVKKNATPSEESESNMWIKTAGWYEYNCETKSERGFTKYKLANWSSVGQQLKNLTQWNVNDNTFMCTYCILPLDVRLNKGSIRIPGHITALNMKELSIMAKITEIIEICGNIVRLWKHCAHTILNINTVWPLCSRKFVKMM